MDESLKYTSDIELLIEDARLRGMTDAEIVRTLCWGCTYADVRGMAKKWAPFLGLTVREFVEYARPKRKGIA
jgi:hypothetical protein